MLILTHILCSSFLCGQASPMQITKWDNHTVYVCRYLMLGSSWALVCSWLMLGYTWNLMAHKQAGSLESQKNNCTAILLLPPLQLWMKKRRYMNPVRKEMCVRPICSECWSCRRGSKHGLLFFGAARAYWQGWQTMMIGLGTKIQG